MSAQPKPSPVRTLETNDAIFRQLVECVKDYAIIMLDPEGYIRTWNVGAERVNGYTKAEITGHHFSVFYTPEDQAREHPKEELEIAEREGRFEEEGWRVRKDGTRFWASVVITRVTGPNGSTVGFAKVTRDLTERKLADERLRESEERARLLYETVRDYALLTIDERGRITTWNEAAHRILGYEASEIVGRPYSIFSTDDDHGARRLEYEIREALTTGRYEDEGWRVRKDGTCFWANVVITPMFDRQRRLRGYAWVARDMTERKRAEDKLRLSNEGLERRVRERTLELENAIKLRDEFLSIASHELRTPLTPLKLQLELILRHLKRGTLASLPLDKSSRMIEVTDRSLARLTALVDNLLDVARINAGKIVLHPEPFDLTQVVNEVCERFRQEAERAGTPLGCPLTPALPVSLDRLRVEQVVANLLTNAIKYGRQRPIQISVRTKDSHALLEVRDEGVGIDDRDYARIFQRFERIGTEPKAAGLGIGLFITKQIVEAHGGRIWLESKLGRGTSFFVELPLSIPATKP